MPLIPSGAPTSTPTFELSCDGSPLPVTLGLIALDTTQDADGNGTATLRFSALSADNDWDAALRAAPLGALLEVSLGYHPQVQPVFTGPVRAHRLLLSEAGPPEMVLEAASQSAPAVLHDEVVLTVQYGATLLAFQAERSVRDTPPATTPATTSLVQGQATLAGTTEVRPGALLAFRGVGEVFGAHVRIAAVHHSFSRGGWTTRADFSAG